MILLALRTLLLDIRGCSAVTASRADTVGCFGGFKAQRLHQFRGGATVGNDDKKIYRTLQVQIVHRHGDRTPITTLKDEDYWASTLIPPDLLEKISSNTKIITSGQANTHHAGGKGAFGKLTQLGLFQMIDLGNTLREELVSDKHPHEYDHPDAYQVDPHSGNKHYKYVFHPQRPLHPKNIKYISTNFPRTIQSAQGLLVGLFPDSTEEPIVIDARQTDIFIPDPQPRQTPEQEALEKELAAQPHLKLKEQEMRPLAIRVTEALKDTLGEGALDISYGVGEEETKEAGPKTLGWAQLAEITKCLQIRNRLPPAISESETEIISKHAAWRWFESLRHPRLAYLAMNRMVSHLIDAMHKHDKEPPVIIYSAHDSTLIGLLCSFRLEQPSSWPEYASYLKLELLEVILPMDQRKEHVVRFSLNGNLLRSLWDEGKDPMMEIPLHYLTDKIKNEGAVKEQDR
jgi:acid phosphatase